MKLHTLKACIKVQTKTIKDLVVVRDLVEALPVVVTKVLSQDQVSQQVWFRRWSDATCSAVFLNLVLRITTRNISRQ